MDTKPKVGLLVTCLVDMMRPSIGFAALRLLEAAGCEVVVPESQTCCGQPGFNAGDTQSARRLAHKLLAEFEKVDYVVAPSGSCAGMVKVHYPTLFPAGAAERRALEELAGRTHELTDFLVSVRGFSPEAAVLPCKATYHDSCAGLRELGVKNQPRQLLDSVAGVQLTEMRECESCCGFGGSFAVKFGAVSTAIVDRKCDDILASGADTVLLGDLGCMLHIEGRLARRGLDHVRVLHIAEALASGEGG